MRPNVPHLLEFLTNEQAIMVHQSVLQVLDEVGVRVEWRPALDVFSENHCHVDFNSGIVRIPPNVLEQALKTCPQEFTLHAPDPQKNIHVTLDDVYTIAGSSALNVLDLDGIHRPATLQDLSDLTRLIDGLEMANIMHAMVIPQDIPQPGIDRVLFSTILRNTTRHYYSQGQGGSSVRDQVELAKIIQGGSQNVIDHPVFSFVICLNSPLVHSAEVALNANGATP